ncbi:TLC domain-containing protein 4-B-like [Carcharodon carcharias]|uniref:TLC domain-containing protein 4-B-like n=1 Tax=Carcharodon carcharias TaxID=13397 RepID=UPI001B7EFCDB|nr:TLC domain-containing protein 4-B-like [Carcharodon carcharias]
MDVSYMIVVGSFFVFQVLFHVVTPRLSTLLSWGYKNLSQEQKTEWDSRCVSTIHALVVGGLALYILWFDDPVNRDHVWGDPTLVKVNIAIASGYLMNDLVLLLRHWKTLGDWFFVSHHLAALYAYQYVLARGLLPYFANFRLIAELSTPFVNQRFSQAPLVPFSVIPDYKNPKDFFPPWIPDMCQQLLVFHPQIEEFK